MKKQDFVKAVANKAWVSQDVAAKLINSFTEVITEELIKWEKITLTGFGSWQVNQRKARNGINPKTGEKIKIPAMKSPAFKSGKTLKEAVRNT